MNKDKELIKSYLRLIASKEFSNNSNIIQGWKILELFHLLKAFEEHIRVVQHFDSEVYVSEAFRIKSLSLDDLIDEIIEYHEIIDISYLELTSNLTKFMDSMKVHHLRGSLRPSVNSSDGL